MEYCVQTVLQVLWSRLREAGARELSYLTALEENTQVLEEESTLLKDLRDDLLTRVEVAEARESLERTHRIERWLRGVDALGTEVDAFDEEARRKVAPAALESCSPHRCWSGYMLGRRAARLLAAVRGLKSEGESFGTVAERQPPGRVPRLLPSTSAVGMESVMEELRGFLLDEGAGAIGVYGPGGSGKSTLLRNLNNDVLSTAEWGFNLVIFVLVSNGDPDSNGDDATGVDRLQQDIGERLELQWLENETRRSRADKIFRALEKKKFLLLLDDLWKPVDLELAGVPSPGRRNKSKVVLSTRSEGICSEMGAHHKVEVKCLGKEAAWELFYQNAELEEAAASSHPQVLQLARAVAAECGGLPLALIVVGRALASKKTAQEWQHALTALQRWPPEIPGMVEKVLSRLRFSFDNLRDDTLRSCFLYCSLFPEDYSIRKAALVDYWVGEGFLDEHGADDDIQEARNKGYDLMGELQSACLLEEGDDPESQVRMHDVIRDLALWIASEEGRNRSRFLVHARAGPKEMADAGNWAEAERISMVKAKGAFAVAEMEAPTSRPVAAMKRILREAVSALGILKETLTMPARNWQLALFVILLVLLPYSVLFLVQALLSDSGPFLQAETQPVRKYSKLPRGAPTEIMEIVLMTVYFLCSVASRFLGFFEVLITTFAASAIYSGEHLSPSELLKRMRGNWRGPALTALYVAVLRSGFWVVVNIFTGGFPIFGDGLFALFLIALNGLLSLLVQLLYYYLDVGWASGQAASVVDGCGGLSALKRAAELTRGRRLRGICVVLFWGIAYDAADVVFGLLVRLFSPVLAGGSVVLIAVCCSNILELMYVFKVAAFVVFYYQLCAAESREQEEQESSYSALA
ncbi:hypothetical protein Taro_022068 [Colocasia esculenta]|uniref:AAA+ ATPase domain-containing protein n=1 Tax=Colocasia esculenta TaxID=4460 RepID=A0A843VA72_COLES|nr:hypothetical protein [Colocasia esculenta]